MNVYKVEINVIPVTETLLIVSDGKEITYDDKAILDKIDEALCNVTAQFDEKKATTAGGNSTTENEDSDQDKIVDVTSVVDDRGRQAMELSL